jgi:hypothetical protein
MLANIKKQYNFGLNRHFLGCKPLYLMLHIALHQIKGDEKKCF